MPLNPGEEGGGREGGNGPVMDKWASILTSVMPWAHASN